MKSTAFSLQPFSQEIHLRDIMVTGAISRTAGIIAVSYILQGPLSNIMIPSSAVPARHNRLWEKTCFEFFLAPAGSEQYWEFNLSPAGHWNVYHFESCREGMKEEPAISSLPFRIHNQSDRFTLTLELDVTHIIKTDQLLKAGISAVIQFNDGNMTFWSLVHPGSQPDFHNRGSFIIEI